MDGAVSDKPPDVALTCSVAAVSGCGKLQLIVTVPVGLVDSLRLHSGGKGRAPLALNNSVVKDISEPVRAGVKIAVAVILTVPAFAGASAESVKVPLVSLSPSLPHPAIENINIKAIVTFRIFFIDIFNLSLVHYSRCYKDQQFVFDFVRGIRLEQVAEERDI